MNILLLAGKRTDVISGLEKAFKEEGFSKVEYLNIARLNLITKRGKTYVKDSGLKIEDYDAVYMRVKLTLAPFVEPLMDELSDKKIYTQIKKGSYYINSNESLQIITLSQEGVKIAKTAIVANPGLLKGMVEEFSYPVIFKSFKGLEKTQAIVLESRKQLASLVKSFKGSVDSAILREFIEAPLHQCAVIGDNVFCIERRMNDDGLEPLAKGRFVKLSMEEKANAINAARVCGCDIATVKMADGNVTEVIPDINFHAFNKKFSEDFYSVVAKTFAKNIGANK